MTTQAPPVDTTPLALKAALIYISRGWPVFPCRPSGKQPLTTNGLKDASTDEEVVRAWWEKWPDANIAIVTGPTFGVVLDVDPAHGGEDSLVALQQEHGNLQATPISLTGGGGRHYVFTYPPGQEIRNKVGLKPGLDIRGDGGYIVAPPSVHESGKRYMWDKVNRADLPLAEMPEWLLALVNDDNGHRSAAPIPDTIVEGGRNHTLTSLAGTMRRRGASEETIFVAISSENELKCSPPLPDEEVRKIAASIASYPPGEQDPHRGLANLPKFEGPIPDGAVLLDDLMAIIRKYVVLADEQATAIALWVLHTHAIDAAETTPYLSIISPEKQSGKTRLLEVLDRLVANPWSTGRTSTAALVRVIEKDHPTLLLDEFDAAFNSGSDYAEALRGVLNNGHRRNGRVTLCVGDSHEVGKFSVFGPKAVAGIGRLPDTVADRSIEIHMKRRAPSEVRADFYYQDVDEETQPLRERLTAWAAGNVGALKSARPAREDFLSDRANEGWGPLFAIADLVGGEWAERARSTAQVVSSGVDREDDSLNVRLLADIRDIFDSKKKAELLSGPVLVACLTALEEAPWGSIKGKPLNPQKLAWRLHHFGIRSEVVRVGETTQRGYSKNTFQDAWSRYLPA